MIDIEPTPKLIKEVKEQILFQQKMGYTTGVIINSQWLETGKGCPIHGVPPNWKAAE